MPNPRPQVQLSLDDLSRGYTVFEPNQVLNEKHLNELSGWFDDQDRLTRVALLCVGIAGGLRARLAGGKVAIARGAGVTTDGDLMLLRADAVFDRFRAYGDAAPVYAPFQRSGQQIPLFELVPEGEQTAAQPLSAFPATLADRVVVMLMETYRKDKDLCTGTACDNEGIAAINTTRFLLCRPEDAAALATRIDTLGSAARGLPVLLADRPQIAAPIGNAAALGARYRAACAAIDGRLAAALPQLAAKVPAFTTDLFGGDPAPDWTTALKAPRDFFANRDSGIQYYYDFLKDVVETWNALRDTLAKDESVTCPPTDAFPKHLLLGSLANPRQSRTDLYPSPLAIRAGTAYEHARFLAWKLHALVHTFALPMNANLAITPSRTEAVPLEERSIPYYYAYSDALPIHAAWSYRRTARGEERRNLGYRAGAWQATDEALRPLGYQVLGYDFLRIEGHLGKRAQDAVAQLRAQLAQANLPVTVRAVLVDTDRARIVVKPPPRYTDLHRFHQLLRQDIVVRLDEANDFNASFKQKIDAAVAMPGSQIPAQINNTPTPEYARARRDEVSQGIAAAKAPLQARGYGAYRSALSAAPGNYLGDYSKVLSDAGNFRSSFSDVARTELATPFDSLMTSPHRAWLSWIDTIIDWRNQREDDRLLFDKFIAEHPGIEHAGGVRPGGTFVMVYGADGLVFGDFALPYNAPEPVDEEPEEPTLTMPPIKPPISIKDGIRILPPIDIYVRDKLEDFRDKFKPEVELKFLKEVMLPQGGLKPFPGGTPPRIRDSLLDAMSREVDERATRVERLRDIVSDPANANDADKVKKAKEMLDQAEAELSDSLTNVTRRVVETKVDLNAEADGAMALDMVKRGLGSVQGTELRGKLGKALEKLKPADAAQPQAIAIEGLLKAGRFK